MKSETLERKTGSFTEIKNWIRKDSVGYLADLMFDGVVFAGLAKSVICLGLEDSLKVGGLYCAYDVGCRLFLYGIRQGDCYTREFCKPVEKVERKSRA